MFAVLAAHATHATHAGHAAHAALAAHAVQAAHARRGRGGFDASGTQRGRHARAPAQALDKREEREREKARGKALEAWSSVEGGVSGGRHLSSVGAAERWTLKLLCKMSSHAGGIVRGL